MPEINFSSLAPGTVEGAVQKLVDSYCAPVFGSLSKGEIDLAMFQLFIELGVIDPSSSSVFDIAATLRITTVKVQRLLRDYSIRQNTVENLMKMAETLLSEKKIIVENGKVAIEVLNPHLAEFLRNELRKMGFITDGSFSANLIKFSIEAYISLMENFANKKYEEIIALLRQNGVEVDGLKQDLRKLIHSAVKQFGGPLPSALLDIIEKYVKKTIDNNSKTSNL